MTCSNPKIKILEPGEADYEQHRKLSSLVSGEFFMFSRGPGTPCVVVHSRYNNCCGSIGYVYVHRPAAKHHHVDPEIHVNTKSLQEAKNTPVVVLELEEAVFRKCKPC